VDKEVNGWNMSPIAEINTRVWQFARDLGNARSMDVNIWITDRLPEICVVGDSTNRRAFDCAVLSAYGLQRLGYLTSLPDATCPSLGANRSLQTSEYPRRPASTDGLSPLGPVRFHEAAAVPRIPPFGGASLSPAT